MPSKLSPWRRAATAARWPVGIGLTSWRYIWRTTPMHRLEEEGTAEKDGPPPFPDGVSREDLQTAEDGAGPLYHRRYRTRIRESDHTPESLIAAITADVDRVAPTEFASFQKVEGEKGEMQVGDEYVVRMPGPWDGPVRCIHRTPTSFRFATLESHLEAGQIEFRCDRDGDLLVFEIESWARGGDRLSNLMYDRLLVSKEVQVHMWTSLLERLSDQAGRMTGGIDIHTRRVEV
jgi:hypothetical protein